MGLYECIYYTEKSCHFKLKCYWYLAFGLYILIVNNVYFWIIKAMESGEST